jgi:hypothetical protein
MAYALQDIAEVALELDQLGHHLVADVLDVVLACITGEQGVRLAVYDPFAVLKVPYRASQSQIKDAFEEAMKELDESPPDKSGYDRIKTILTWAVREAQRAGAALYWGGLMHPESASWGTRKPEVTWTGYADSIGMNKLKGRKAPWGNRFRNWWDSLEVQPVDPNFRARPSYA